MNRINSLPIKQSSGLLLLLLHSFQIIFAQDATNNNYTQEQHFQHSNNQISSANFFSSSPTLAPNSNSKLLRVNVSNICEKNHMRATIRLSRPFYGLIHTKDKRKKAPCSLEGNGEQAYTLEISYTLIQSEPNFCGVVSHHNQQQSAAASSLLNSSAAQQSNQQTLSVALVVRLHKTIEFSDDRYFLLSCANRCARPDCSSLLASLPQQQAASSGNFNARGQTVARNFLATSESILSPILRASPNEIAAPNEQSSVTSQLPGCDTLLDLKFQWLVKLCWVLGLLLVLMFCTAYGLCLALNRMKIPQTRSDSSLSPKVQSSSSKKQQVHRSKSTLNKLNAPTNKPKDTILYPQAQLQDQNWLNAGSANTVSSSATCPLEDLEQIREDNSFLAKHQHQQQMIFANQLLLDGAEQSNLSSVQSNAALLDHQVSQPVAEQQQELLLGRSAQAQLLNAQNHQRQLEARLKRRRSIGSFTPAVGELYNQQSSHTINLYNQQQQQQQLQNHHHHHLQHQQQQPNYKLDPGIRAKSKSQTTIHYDQTQDPFETIPFSFVNNAYLSDDGGAKVSVTNNESDNQSHGRQQVNYPGENVNHSHHHTNESHQHQHHHHLQTPMTVQSKPQQQPMTQGRSELMRLQKWPNLKPNYVAPPQADSVQPHSQAHPQSHPMLTSQFDPQNSRQLIDLIQLKHRQQIAQANKTAASIQELPRQQVVNQQQQHQSRNNMQPHQLKAWR